MLAYLLPIVACWLLGVPLLLLVVVPAIRHFMPLDPQRELMERIDRDEEWAALTGAIYEQDRAA
jgi:hypothetical protein